MARKNELTRESDADRLQADKAARLKGQRQAELWLEWHAERRGIALPPCDYSVRFQTEEDGTGLAVLTERYGCPAVDGGELMRLPVPAWAMPQKRVDLWHAAHQSGATLAHCADEGTGWRANREQRLKSRAAKGL